MPGALGTDKGTSIAVDKSGHAYITGSTDSSNFPVTNGVFQLSNPGDNNAFVSKLNPKGTALVYSSYLGGNDDDYGTAIAVDSKGNAYVTGGTYSTNFPITAGSFQPVCGGGINYSNCWDAFITKVNPKGSALVYSTYLGGNGNDWGYALALDGSDNIYIGGTTVSANFPVLHAFQPVIVGPIGFSAVGDAFVAKLDPTGSTLIYSSFLGGGSVDQVNGIGVDAAGNAYVAGETNSADFPLSNALKPFLTGADGFVAAISAQPSDVTQFPLHLDFNYFPIGEETGQQASTLTNSSAHSVNISSISLTGPNAADFAETNTCPASLAAGSNCAITVTFTPSTFGIRSATVSVASDGPAQNVTITGFGQAPTQMTLTSYPNPSTQGQPVTFQAVVTSNFGPPPGGDTVYFVSEGKKGGVLGTAAMNNSGNAFFTTSQLPVGTTLVSAYWIGDTKFGGSTSNTVVQAVNSIAKPIQVGKGAAGPRLSGQSRTPIQSGQHGCWTTTNLTTSGSPSHITDDVTFTADVNALSYCHGQQMTCDDGEVLFYDHNQLLATKPVNNCQAQFDTFSLAVGEHHVRAVFNPESRWHQSSARLIQVVDKWATTTALASTPNPSSYKQERHHHRDRRP